MQQFYLVFPSNAYVDERLKDKNGTLLGTFVIHI